MRRAVAAFLRKRNRLRLQHMDDLVDGLVGDLRNAGGRQFGHRMRHHGNRQARHAETFRLRLAERKELVRAGDRNRNAALFELDRIVDTPRRAGASIAERGRHRMDPVEPLLREGRRFARNLLEEREFEMRVTGFQPLCYLLQVKVRIGLEIGEQPDDADFPQRAPGRQRSVIAPVDAAGIDKLAWHVRNSSVGNGRDARHGALGGESSGHYRRISIPPPMAAS